MEVIIGTCCGIDVHQKTIVCCVLDGPLETNKPSKHHRVFGTTTAELKEALEWLNALNVTDIFMESTGQYWVPVFNIFADSEMQLILANPRILKTCPAEKQTSKTLSGWHNWDVAGSLKPLSFLVLRRWN